MFLSLVGYMVYFNVTKTEEISHNQYNTKMDAQEGYVVRGSIVSSDGEIIAGTNIDEEGNETRVYPEGRLYAHVLGYTTNGKSGLESIYNGDLLTSNSSIIDKVGNEAANRKVKGDSLHVTLSTKMQQAASTALGAYRGAVIVMEPSTGKILAMVSKPDFNPNEMEESWEYLTAEDSKSPLLNRVTQGLYPPGSTFKIVTALEYLKEHPDDYTDYAYNCSGTNAKDDVTIKCYDYIAHGYEDLQTSFANSCNTSFANIGLSLDGNKFRDTCKELLFNGDLPIELAYSESQFKLNSRSSYGEVMTTSIGQGDTLVSPFHMALIVSSVANKGVLMTPYLVDHIENNEGAVVKETKPTQFKQMMTAEQAGLISSYMQSVVEYGTATSLSGRGYTVAGKTGSAEYEVDGNTGEEENFSTHSWFVGFSNVENPDIVVCVIAEDGGTGSSAAVPIAAQIFDTYYYG
ncbi:MAG: penicillin-binding transpeptidase domain-containing protein [Eubacteriales bacterium]|nr:penicillin-binding transpeptidase domain-containing protein [Eubacteriales bacterium]